MASRLWDRCANIRKIPSEAEQAPYKQLGLVGLPLILLRRSTIFIFFIVVSIMWKNWKTLTIKNPHLKIPDDEPVFKYDDHHDETININTGEVITND